MKRKITLIAAVLLCLTNVFAQRNADLQKLVETENAFAAAVETKGINAAFIEYLTDDGVMFDPQQVNGKELWRLRPASPALLSWYPTFVDISSNGALGYTIGEGEYRPQGKSDTTVYYSTYATVWRRQPDASFKAVMDVGISHGKPPTADKTWKSPNASEKSNGVNNLPVANAMSEFYDAAATKGLAKAYKKFAAEDTRFLREGKFPISEKSNAPSTIKKSKITFGKTSTMLSAGDLGYSITTYEIKSNNELTEKGNIVQIWKLFGKSWQIVLDVFAPIPDK